MAGRAGKERTAGRAGQERKAGGADWSAGAALVLGCLVIGSLGTLGADPGVTLAVPGRSNANVSIAARGAFVVAVWSGSMPRGATDIFAAISRDAGATFSPPSRVNTTPGEASVNGEQPPRVALVDRADTTTPTIVVIWTAKGIAGTKLLTARSIDAGRTFSRSAGVPGSDAPGNRGWQAIAADASGRVSVVWLDHRALAGHGDHLPATRHETSTSGTSAPKTDGVATAQLSQLYYATIDQQPSTSRALTGGVCYCCKTAIATGPGNTIAIAWRHVYPGNLRDIAFTSSRDGGRTFGPSLRVSEDKWQLEGCPDDGPAIAVDGQGMTHLTWPTLVTERGTPTIGLFYAMSRDGRQFTARERIPAEGVPHHPQVAVTREGVLTLAWDELLGGKRRAVAARGTMDVKGRLEFRRVVVSGSEAAVYPFVALTAKGPLVGWTSSGPGNSVVRIVRPTF